MNPFPIPSLDRLPTRIEPCPIVEAVLEIRFTTEEPWELLPGVLSTHIRDKYPRTAKLPLAEIPEQMRKADPLLVHQPLIQFIGNPFLIQFGPRVISLIANQNYPGWTAVFEEMQWLMAALKRAKFIVEGERLGLRYMDFFELDLFQHLMIQVQSDGKRVSGTDLNLTAAFERDGFAARLVLANRVFVKSGEKALQGSVFDLDLALGAGDFDLFENGLRCFERAHQTNKEVFFGLLDPQFLTGLNPIYA